MITYDMSQRQGISKYEYLFQRIRDDIRSGTIAPRAKLPSKRALATHLSVSVSTVEGAYDLLVSAGYVESRPGSGYFVVKRHSDFSDPAILSAGNEALPTAESRPNVIDMHANSCSLELFPSDTWARIMRRVLSEKAPELFETVPFGGLPQLRLAIAQSLYEFRGMQVDPNRIIIGAGTEYLYTKVLQLFGNDAVFAFGDVGFTKLTSILNASGIRWVHVPVDEGGVRVDMIEQGPANIAHVSPANHFPMGAVMPLDRRERLLKWVAQDKSRYIIEDNYDSELQYAGRPHPPLYTQDSSDRVIYMNTFSKTLVPSLRISYMILPEALMELYCDQLGFYSCTVSSFEQSALAEFIARGYFERHINRLRRFYDKQRLRITNALASSKLSPLIHMRPVNVGTHMLVDVNTCLPDTQVKEAARSHGMHLNVLSDYCLWPTAATAHTIVINYASITPDQIDVAINVLEEIFASDIERVGSASRVHAK